MRAAVCSSPSSRPHRLAWTLSRKDFRIHPLHCNSWPAGSAPCGPSPRHARVWLPSCHPRPASPRSCRHSPRRLFQIQTDGSSGHCRDIVGQTLPEFDFTPVVEIAFQGLGGIPSGLGVGRSLALLSQGVGAVAYRTSPTSQNHADYWTVCAFYCRRSAVVQARGRENPVGRSAASQAAQPQP